MKYLLLLLLGIAPGLIGMTTPNYGADERTPRYGMTCISNNTNQTINFDYKWGGNGRWRTVCLRSGSQQWLSWEYNSGTCSSPELYVSFDYDLSCRNKQKKYCLQRYRSAYQDCDDARKYHFKKCGSMRLDLFSSSS